ncbi:MAG: hypothetical protein V1891_00530 [bacterium]
MKMINLRNKIFECANYPGMKILKNAPVCHKGFPNCFNLSFTEYEMINEFGNYLNYDKNLIFSKIQPCIRHNDWELIIKNNNESYRYLSLFDMAGIGGCIALADSKEEQNKISEYSINTTIKFLIDLGFDIKKIKVTYFSKCLVSKATARKYNIRKFYPTDLWVNYWKKYYHLKKNQLIIDQSRNTMLALNIFGLPTPWGYRNEILYEYKNKLLDIATIEHLCFSPIFNKNEIVGFNKNKNSMALSVAGVERLLMVINNLDNIWEVETISPIINFISKKAVNHNKSHILIATQAIRVLHRIFTDCESYSKLQSAHRKMYTRIYAKSFINSLKNLGIKLDLIFLTDLLKLNSELQPYYPELHKSLNRAADEILLRKKAFETDKSIKSGGVAQK